MLTINVHCDCGQHYEFDVESSAPLTEPIACPACGIDSTDRANAAIAQQTTLKPAATPGLRISAHQPTASAAGKRTVPGQLDHDKALQEARAKITWGDSPAQVASFLRVHGFSSQEASEFVDEAYRERLATVRNQGIGNIVVGSLIIAVPVVFWIVSMRGGVLYVRVFGLTIVAGFFGLWRLVRGLHIFLSPKSQTGHSEEPD